MSKRIGELLDQRGAAKQRCDTISATDPFSAMEQAQLQLELAEADYRQLQQLTGAHQMLQALFQEAQADLSSRYSEPLARAIGEQSIEDMTRDLLKVMLKQWLDEKLPSLVERLVREEIERVARTGR